MKRLACLVALALITLVVIVPAARAQQQTSPAQWSVSITDSFDPADVAIAPGDTITWTNQDDEPHTVTAYDGSFDSGVLNPGDMYTVTFLGAGTWSYYCTIHPRMVGSVTTG